MWRESGIVEALPAVDPSTGMLPRMWTAKIGSGYAGPAVADGRVFVTDRLADQNLERVLCFDANTGKELWKHEYEARYAISYPLGPRATPTVDGDRVYTLGAVGHLFCFEAATGKILWQKHLPTDFGTPIPQWGTAGAPLVDGDQLIVLAGGKPNALVVSLDKKTGEERWRASMAKSPATAARDPRIRWPAAAHRLASGGSRGLEPTSGKVLWEVPFAVQFGLTIPTPRKLGNQLFVTSFYNGPLMIDLGDDGISPRVLWRTAANNTEKKTTACTPSCVRRLLPTIAFTASAATARCAASTPKPAS